MMPALIDELLKLEHDGWQSLCDGTGAGFYGSLMADDGIMTLAHGVTLDREGVIGSLDDAPPWHRYEIEDARAIPLGPDAAALTYLGRGFREGERPFVALMSSIYRRDAGAWRLVLYQQTPVPGAE